MHLASPESYGRWGAGDVWVEGHWLPGSFHRVRSRYIHAVTHTGGEEWFSAGDGESSCVLFVTGPTAKERRAR